MLEDRELPEEIKTVQMQDVGLPREPEFGAGIRVGERSVHRPTERRCVGICCKDVSAARSLSVPIYQQPNHTIQSRSERIGCESVDNERMFYQFDFKHQFRCPLFKSRIFCHLCR
jgi:hypothetical protein